jgi:uncharacterized protein (DUF2384 family)
VTGFEGFGSWMVVEYLRGAPQSRPGWGTQYARYRGVPSANLKEGVQDLTAPQLPISSIVPVVAHAVAVFGDEHKASNWLSTPLALLENRAPSELLNSHGGHSVR